MDITQLWTNKRLVPLEDVLKVVDNETASAQSVVQLVSPEDAKSVKFIIAFTANLKSKLKQEFESK